jgi:hypothetical protein
MIINQEELDKAILDFENLLSSYNPLEVDLIMQYVRMRRAKKLSDMRVKETIESNPIMKFAKKFVKGQE